MANTVSAADIWGTAPQPAVAPAAAMPPPATAKGPVSAADIWGNAAGGGEWEDNSPLPGPMPSPQLNPVDRFGRQISHGVERALYAPAQVAYNLLPTQNDRSFVDDAANWVAGKLGLSSRIPAGGFNEFIAKNDADYQKWRASQGSTGVDWGGGVGNAIGAIPMVATLPEQAGVGGAALVGGLSNVLSQPVDSETDFFKQKIEQLGLGYGTGGLTTSLLGGVSRALSPNVSKDVQTLLDAGVTPTPGQILGGAANRIEQGSTSIPVLGDMVKNAQRRAAQDLNDAAINRSLAPIGEKLPQDLAGRDAISYAAGKLGDAYDTVLNRIGAAPVTPQLTQSLGTLRQLTANLPKAQQDQFDAIIKNEIGARIDPASNTITGEGIKAIESNLGNIARGYGRSQDYSERQLAGAVSQAQDEIRNWLAQVSPQNAPVLKAINEGWANFKRPAVAAAMRGSEGGVFTPAQLQAAVRATDSSKDKMAFAKGNALMQDLSDAAQNVMGSKVPDSGTPFRHAVQWGGAMLLGEPVLPAAVSGPIMAAAPIVGGAGVLASLPYTKAGQKLAAYLLTQRPDWAAPAAQALRQGAPYAGVGTSPLLAQALLQGQQP